MSVKNIDKDPLNSVLDLAQRKSLWVIFDLDSTLFNVSHRTEAILRSVAEHPEFLEEFPEECKQLQTIKVHERDWGIKTALERSGVRSTVRFFDLVRSHWMEHFFSNNYLDVDQPYEGAVEFVQALKEAGARIQYLTGRDKPRMGQGTLASLRQWGFPLDREEDLVLKPHKSMDDAEFKKNYFLKIHQLHEDLWLFENEPRIIHLIRETCPSVQLVFMDSVHSGRAEAPTDLPMISLRYDFKGSC